jgi:21S rRNA (GM2251-2'-O)-methyltransferase
MAGRRDIKELIIQSGMDLANKKDAVAVKEILHLAEQKGVEVREFSKHDLNMMTDNKPHQGFVLRAQPLNFTSISHLEPSPQFRYVLRTTSSSMSSHARDLFFTLFHI